MALLGGRPLIAHVIANALHSRSLSDVLVATDDLRIADAARDAGASVALTPSELPSGSDRVAAAAEAWMQSHRPMEIVVNIQGDEPFLTGDAIDAAIACLVADPQVQMATLAVPASHEEFRSPDSVKVVCDHRGRALYFSRASIPYVRADGASVGPLKHVGLYAFRREYLQHFVSLGPSDLERAEQLEQLRALQDGAGIAVAVGTWSVLGVDTPQDLERAEQWWSETVSGTRRGS